MSGDGGCLNLEPVNKSTGTREEGLKGHLER